MTTRQTIHKQKHPASSGEVGCFVSAVTTESPHSPCCRSTPYASPDWEYILLTLTSQTTYWHPQRRSDIVGKVDQQTTAYRYRVTSQPVCGVGAGRIDIHALSRPDADLMLIACELRRFEDHASHEGTTYDWTVGDRYGRLLVSATTTPDGTTYHDVEA